MPRSLPAIGLNAAPASPATTTAPMAASTGGSPAPPSSVSPIAAIAADIANSPVCSQNASAYSGSHSRNTISATSATRVARRRRSDTGQLPCPEQTRRPPQQHEQQHDERDDLRQPAAEERDLVLVAGRERRRHADHEPADDRARR